MFVENLKETLNLGKKLSHKLNPQSIVLLQGPIGSGKIPLIHLDLYRLENVSLAKEVFFAEEEEAIQKQAILVIEWPELVEPVIDNFWKIEISYAKNYGRHYEIRDPKNLLTFS